MPDRPLPAPLPLTEDHPERLAVAQQIAAWELGDGSWADLIVAAYLNPEAADARLAREMRTPR
jgi:hypothetical protein